MRQDRQGVRTPADLERRHNLGGTRKMIQEISVEVEENAKAVDGLDQKLNQSEIFNRLTNNGEIQGFYQENGKLYINAEFVAIVNLVANMISAGILKSVDGTTYFDLDNAEFVCKGTTGNAAITAGGFVGEDTDGTRRISVVHGTDGSGLFLYTTGDLGPFYALVEKEDHLYAYLADLDTGDTPTRVIGHKIGFKTINGVKTLVAYD